MSDRRTGPSFVRNLLGRIGDRMLPGDNYNKQTGAWNATGGQWATGIGSKVLGAINPLAGLIGGAVGNGMYGDGPLAGLFGGGAPSVPPQPWNPQAVQNQNINNMTDKLASNERRIGDELSKALSAYGGGNSRGSRPSAGSSVLAEGQAAQNMVGAMQLQASLNAGKAQARKAMNPANTYEY